MIDETTALVTTQAQEILSASTLTRAQVATLRNTVAKGTTDEELQLFLHVCRRTQLDPFARQIYAIKRDGKMTIQTSIDGYRLIAERTGKYRGQLGPQWTGDGERWVEVWTKLEPPLAARVAALRSDFSEPMWAIARYKDFVPAPPNDFMWKKMGPHQIGKCAEALALRRAFPQELGGLYLREEMQAPGIEAAARDNLAHRVGVFKGVLQAATTPEERAAKWEQAAPFRQSVAAADQQAAGELERFYAELSSGAVREASPPPVPAPPSSPPSSPLKARVDAFIEKLKAEQTADAVKARMKRGEGLLNEIKTLDDVESAVRITAARDERLRELQEGL